jgi:hypothetical protein
MKACRRTKVTDCVGELRIAAPNFKWCPVLPIPAICPIRTNDTVYQVAGETPLRPVLQPQQIRKLVQAARRNSLYQTTRIRWCLYSQSPSGTNLMPSNIDIRDGSISLGEGHMLAQNIRLHQVLGMGLTVWNDRDIKNGWRHLAVKDFFIFEKPASAVLYFFDDELKMLQVMLLDQDGSDREKVRLHHDEVLANAFGPPHTRDIHGFANYSFPWGNVGSFYDPRTDQSYIAQSWK